MNRRVLLAGCLAVVAFGRTTMADADPPGTAGDLADVARVQAYLNGITTLQARFIQVAPDGQISQGTAWLERPGRMRFAYDKPSPLLLVAGHGVVTFHDAELDQTSTIPLANTPLGILLAPQVQLGGAVTVESLTRQPGEIMLTLARTATPADGQLALVLTDQPLLLTSWTVTDAQQQQTRISLSDVRTGGTFNQSLFDYTNADESSSPRSGP